MELTDLDPMDREAVDALLKEHDVKVSVDSAFIGPKVSERTRKRLIEDTESWSLGWKHGCMDLMDKQRPEEDARAASAVFVQLWLSKTGMNPGTLRDMAVIYVCRCMDVERMAKRVKEFLAEVEKLDTPETQDALYSKVYEVNKMQWEGKFEEVNCLLRDFRPFKRSPGAAVAFLGYTSQAKDKLPARKRLHEDALEAETKRSGESAAKNLFGGLQ